MATAVIKQTARANCCTDLTDFLGLPITGEKWLRVGKVVGGVTALEGIQPLGFRPRRKTNVCFEIFGATALWQSVRRVGVENVVGKMIAGNADSMRSRRLRGTARIGA